MSGQTDQEARIRQYIIDNVEENPAEISKLLVEEFDVSRMTANRYLSALVKEGVLRASGKTKGTTYELVSPVEELESDAVPDENFVEVEITADSKEDAIIREHIAPKLTGLPENILEIANWGLSEMINNVIDHSGSDLLLVAIRRSSRSLSLQVKDYGVGIFKKIAKETGLSDEREAILELAKGKLTTDPTKHSGEGIFFTSRMFTIFRINSRNLLFEHDGSKPDGDWLWEVDEGDVADGDVVEGTSVYMEIELDSKRTAKDVIMAYDTVTEDDTIDFSRTHVPVRLALYPNEQLVSRSQAKRVLLRFNKFKEVTLDFDKVPTIGQAFADEIFRVFSNAHPEIKIVPIRANTDVQYMIDRAKRASN